jgi:hypothetical protein
VKREAVQENQKWEGEEVKSIKTEKLKSKPEIKPQTPLLHATAGELDTNERG